MPRDIKKLKELERIISNKDLEIAKYKQLINSIQALITINGVKLDEDTHADLLADQQQPSVKEWYDIYDKVKEQFKNKEIVKPDFKKENDKAKENWERGEESIKKARQERKQNKEELAKAYDEWSKDPDEHEQPKKETEPSPPQQGSRSRNLEHITKKTHVDELNEIMDESDEAPKPSDIIKKRKQKQKIPTNIKEVEELEKQRQAEEATKPKEFDTRDAHASYETYIRFSNKVDVNELPTEAKILIESNKARARAAEREKHHGEEGQREYERLLKKEQQEKGELPTDGNCPHCKEQLEAPITRGHHSECWEAKQRKEQGN